MGSSGPVTLQSLKKGQNSIGDSGCDPTVLPDWMDRERFRRGQTFYVKHRAYITALTYVSFIVGMCLKNLHEALIFTGKHSTPGKALVRMFTDFSHIHWWHTEDVWDVNSRGHKSLMKVRRAHRILSKKMHKHEGGQTEKVSQYDMALVQSSFIFGSVKYYRQIGLKTTPEELEDYIFFWRGIGYLLGIEDEYNVCTRVSYEEMCALCAEFENMIAPMLLNPSKEHLNLVRTSLKSAIGPLPLISVESLMAYAMELSGNDFWLNQLRLSFTDKCRVNIFRLMLWFMRSVPGFEIFVNYVFNFVYVPALYLIVKLLK